MPFKITLNYSPNFNLKKRLKKQIRFIILHYTGMKSENAAINKLTNIQSQVASHYLITLNGKIINLVPDLYIAWHAGISSWKTLNSLNKNSIGIEITNPGHQFGYKKFSKKQINSLINLSKFLIKKYKINKKNILGHSDIAFERKKDPGEKFPWKFLASKGVGIWHSINNTKLKKLRKFKLTNSEKLKGIRFLEKIGYSPNKEKDKNYSKLIKSFQRRFRQELIDGRMDKECLMIAKKLSKTDN